MFFFKSSLRFATSGRKRFTFKFLLKFTKWQQVALSCFLPSEMSKKRTLCSLQISNYTKTQIFFGGLNSNTTEDDVRKYFSQFGELHDIRLVRSFIGHSKNYGFLSYKCPRVEEKVLGQMHLIQGKPISVSRGNKNRAIYVVGLPSHFTDSEVKTYFSKYGEVESVRIFDSSLKNKGMYNYAFVTFSCEEEASKASAQKDQIINKVMVHVKARSENKLFSIEAEVSQSRKIKVLGLPFETTSVDKIKEYFEQFGALSSIDLLFSTRKRSCAAIVIFNKKESAEKSIAVKNPEIDGIRIQLMYIPDSFRSTAQERSLYLENLSPQTNSRTIMNYFFSYGTVAKAFVLRDEKTGESLRCGIVKFRYIDSMSQFKAFSEHIIDGYAVTIRRRSLKLNSKDILDNLFNLDLSDNDVSK